MVEIFGKKNMALLVLNNECLGQKIKNKLKRSRNKGNAYWDKKEFKCYYWAFLNYAFEARIAAKSKRVFSFPVVKVDYKNRYSLPGS